MEILLKPIVTEKMTKKSEKLNQFGFVVDKNACKAQIKSAVEQFYNVEVVAINTAIVAGKYKTKFTKSGVQHGSTSSYKKAIVTIKEGQNIDFFSNI